MSASNTKMQLIPTPITNQFDFIWGDTLEILNLLGIVVDVEADVEGDRRDVLDVESSRRLSEGDEMTSLQGITLIWMILCMKRGTWMRYSLKSTKVLSAASNLRCVS